MYMINFLNEMPFENVALHSHMHKLPSADQRSTIARSIDRSIDRERERELGKERKEKGKETGKEREGRKKEWKNY